MDHTNDRRDFLKLSLAGTAALLAGCSNAGEGGKEPAPTVQGNNGPIVLSTWDHGMAANAKAMSVLRSGGTVLDAVEQGVMVTESDFTNRSVGLGGMPDRAGIVTLDACIQDHDGRAGSVAFVSGFEHPISMARAVMERTPHVMLVGEGAEQWALENGFHRYDLPMPEDVRKAWGEWKTKNGAIDSARVNVERLGSARRDKQLGGKDNHDTIGMIAMDANGRLAGSCTTSGLAFKIRGRVGDSPIIGAGLFVDGEVGAACATGTGELMIRTAGSHTVVELMRQGMAPEEACKQAVERILRKHPGMTGQQVGFLALRADGAYGAYSLYNGFNFALHTAEGNTLNDAAFAKTWE